jgi:hypothetical protein
MNPGTPFQQTHAIFLPSVTWVAATGFVFAGAIASRLPGFVSKAIHTSVGFFLTAVAALLAIHYHMRPLGFAILFFLLCTWSAATIRTEGFVCLVQQVDAVENQDAKWFVENVLKENPKGVKTTTDTTAAVGGSSAQSGTSTGTT